MLKISGYTLKQLAVPGVKMRPYPHQAKMFAEWDKHDAFMMITKTGSGKTRAVTLPILKHGESAVFVYPTNALISDQLTSIIGLLEDEGFSYREVTPENYGKPWAGEEYAILQINADILAEYKKAMKVKTKGEAFLRLLMLDKKKLVLVNPDILFLVLSLRYGKASAEILSHFAGYTTLVLDEFHMYTGVELAHLLFTIFLSRKLKLFKRVVLLSATPNQEVFRYVDRLLKPYLIDVNAKVGGYKVVKTRYVVHPVELRPVVVSNPDTMLEEIAQLVMTHKDKLYQLRHKRRKRNLEGKYVPLVIILNSVIDARDLEMKLVDMGFDRRDIASIRGLTSRRYRDMRGKLIVIGTSAIEVGIDFDTDYLIFEASDVASFLQRFGRIGRHKAGVAYLICNKTSEIALQSFGDKLKRDELESLVHNLYPYRKAWAWFMSTFSGMVCVFAQAYHFIELVNQEGTGSLKLQGWLEGVVNEYANLMGWGKTYQQMLSKLERDWFRDFVKTTSFRASTPTFDVWDKQEKKWGKQVWNYDVDLRMLLRKCIGLHLDKTENRLYVDGFKRESNRVSLQYDFSDLAAKAGTMMTTGDPNLNPAYLNLLVNGAVTPLSKVMYENEPHLFVFVPRTAVMKYVDWRIGWFPCGESGDFIVAFDGDALLLREVYHKYRTGDLASMDE